MAAPGCLACVVLNWTFMAKLVKEIPRKSNFENSIVLRLVLASADNAFLMLFFLPPSNIGLKF